MGLSARDRQALISIESHLAESDPDLAVRMAAFARFASGADMPAAEASRAGWRHVVSSLVRWMRRPRRRGHGRAHSTWVSALMAFWVAVTCALIATAALLSNVATNGRCSALAVTCGSRAPADHAPHGAR